MKSILIVLLGTLLLASAFKLHSKSTYEQAEVSNTPKRTEVIPYYDEVGLVSIFDFTFNSVSIET